jgi:4-amino-4-deoxy-L-arabinose transferase-like glycosyltransferase
MESEKGDLYRPIVILSYALNYKLGGLRPFGYHLANIFLHALNSVLVYLLAHLIFERKRPALFSALLFAIHPVHTEAVTGVVGRAELLAFLFSLSSLLMYITSKERKGYVLSLAFFLLALFSKENALILPFVLMLYDLTFRRDTSKTCPCQRLLAQMRIRLRIRPFIHVY